MWEVFLYLRFWCGKNPCMGWWVRACGEDVCVADGLYLCEKGSGIRERQGSGWEFLCYDIMGCGTGSRLTQ